MTRTLKGVMRDYLVKDDKPYARDLPEFIERMPIVESNTPIKPATGKWEVVKDPTRLHKTFEFDGHTAYKEFIFEVLSYENDIGHYGKLIADYPRVTIEVNTRNLELVTEVDQEYSAMVDNIYDDVSYYSIDAPIGEGDYDVY